MQTCFWMAPAENPQEMQQMQELCFASQGDLWIQGKMSEYADQFFDSMPAEILWETVFLKEIKGQMSESADQFQDGTCRESLGN